MYNIVRISEMYQKQLGNCRNIGQFTLSSQLGKCTCFNDGVIQLTDCGYETYTHAVAELWFP
jgi:hypothetical protein